MRRQLAGLKEECAKVGRDFSKLDITVMISLPDERTQTQEIIGAMAGMAMVVTGEVTVRETASTVSWPVWRISMAFIPAL